MLHLRALCVCIFACRGVLTNSIIEIPLEFNTPPGAENSTTHDHNKVVMCKVFFQSRTYPGKGKYDWNDAKDSFDGNLCSHLILSWFNIDNDYEIIANEHIGQLNNTATLKSKFPHLKIFIEVAPSQTHTEKTLMLYVKTLMTSPQNNFKFIRNMKNILKLNGYDGLHVGPQFYLYSTGKDFTSFAINLRDEFHSAGFLLSTEVESYTKELFQNDYQDIAAVSKILDFVSIRTYGFDQNSRDISHQAPIYSKSGENIWSILMYLLIEKRLEPRSTVLGISLNGKHYCLENDESLQFPFGWNSTASVSNSRGPNTCKHPITNSKGGWRYYEICSTALNGTSWHMYWDSDAKVPFIKRDQEWTSFENPQSIYEKSLLAAKIGLGGIMFRSSDMDDFHGLCGNVKNPMQKTANFALSTNEDASGTTFCSFLTSNTVQDVQYKPTLSTNYYVMSVTANSTAEIRCTADGNPEPDISVMKHFLGNEIELKTDRFLLVNIQSLDKNRACTINRKKVLTLKWIAVGEQDLGKYRCSASNSLGTVTTSFFLRRHDKPFVVANDKIWVEQKDADFIFEANTQNRSWTPKHGKVVICEISTHNDQQLENLTNFDGKLCTHLVYGNISMSNNDQIEENIIVQLLDTKSLSEIFPRMKILFRISLDNHQQFKKLKRFMDTLDKIGDTSQKLKANSKIRNIFTRFGIHGFYLVNNLGLNANRTKLANKLKGEFKEGGEFLFATEINPHNPRGLRGEEELDVTQVFDIIVVKPYYFQITENIAEHNSPLRSNGKGNKDFESVVNFLLNDQKIPANKLIMSLPTFGYEFWLTDPESFPFGLNSRTNETKIHFQDRPKRSYKEICSILLAKERDWKIYWDRKAQVPFAKFRNRFLTFDNPKSIFEKSLLALGKDLLGVMITFIDFDDDDGSCGNIKYPLLKAVNLAFNSQTQIITENKDNGGWKISKWEWIAIVGAFCLLTILISVLYARRKLKTEGLSRHEIESFIKGVAFQNSDETPEYAPYKESFEISNKCYSVDKTKILGMGAFGIVFTGIVNDSPVAVKSTKPGAEKQYLISLLSELKINIFVGKHPHIVNLIGAHTTELNKGILYIFVELCPLGNLQDYLRRSRDNFTPLMHNDCFHHLQTITEGGNLTTDNLLNWAYQIALALEHLSSKKVIHGDLAARNVLLFEQNIAKLTDFGLSRKLYQYSNYVKKTQEPLPWRWMAIESLRDLSFSVESDIWSFGITVWEIFSLGEVPYPGLSWNISFLENLQENLRLPKAKFATTSLHKFMLECWKVNPSERPQPQMVSTYIHQLLHGSVFKDYYLDIQTNSTAAAEYETETKL